MPLKAYIEGRPRISRHFRGDMRPDDATEDVYRGSAAHISSPPLCNGGLWKDGRFLRPHRQKRKVGDEIPPGENCRLMRRDAALSTSLRTDLSIYALYGIICAQRRQSGNASAHWLHIKGCCFGRPSEQIYLGKRLPARASYNSWVSIDCFSCKIMPFFNFSHRLLQVILFSMTTGLYTHIRIKSKAGRPSRAALPR